MKKLFTTLLLLLAVCMSAFSQNKYPVRFAHGTEYFPENFANHRQMPPVSAEELVNGVYTRYIQLEKIMNAQQRESFEATGARIIGYVQLGAYLVMLPQGFDFQKIESFAPRSIMPVNPAWKMAKSLRELPYGAWAVHGDFIDVNLQLYPFLRIAEGAALCRINGMDVLKEGTQNGFVQVRIHKDHVAEVAAKPFVQYLELVPAPGQKEDTRGRSLHRSNLVASDAPMGKKYDGAGVAALVRDDGQLGPHIDIQGRLYNYALGAPASGTHGDGVVGIVGGAGNLDPTKKGMAAGADLYSVDYVNDFQDLTLPLHFDEGVTLTNSSYSDGCNAGYTLATQTVDEQLFDNPTLMHIFSGGNSNGNDCGYGAGNQWGNITGGHKMSKNAIATANLFADASLVTSSSRGPAYDGRLKPDIAANGQDQESLDPNNGYQVFGGTSAAAPGIMGCMAQLTHAYRTIKGVTDVPSALIKATMLNTANDLGNIGPDFRFGWGHINAWRALNVLEQNQWLEGSIDQSGDLTHTIQIPAGVKEAKIMLYWAEPPASESAAMALLNDLDLTVENGSGVKSLPWKLDPTPNPTILNTPAGKGRDSLNNVEQVQIDNPVAGTYTIRINGTAVPLGPQHYYIVWEFVRDEIKITYPTGSEGFVPGEVERIHWDAYGNTGNFTLRYSTNGGENFSAIGTVTGDKRMYDWTVPNTVSGNVKILVIRAGKRDTSDFASSIVQIPQDLQVIKVCPDSITLGWSEVNDTLSYDGYLLGNKYMELKGTSDSNSVAMPIQNGAAEQWLSVRSSHPSGIAGRRALAIHWPGGLLACPQNYDLGVRELVSPSGNAIVTCGISEVSITIRVNNEGLNPSTGATAYYQVDNNTPIAELLPDIPADSSLEFTFQTPLTIDFNGIITLKAWVVFPDDLVDFNDTLSQEFTVISGGANQFFTEDFEASPALPAGWASLNPDGLIGWQTSDDLPFSIVGPDDIFGRSLHLNFFQYGPNEEGQEDYLYMIPVDLNGLSSPLLTFQLAHARYDATFTDALRVEVYADCKLGEAPITVWEKSDPDLATVPNQISYYYAGSGQDWRGESVDLSAFEGQKIIVRFVAVNGYGNSLYLDNIGINTFEPPLAEFMVADTICRLDTVIYQATPSTFGASYTWNFGAAAIPNAATGIGPHTVTYPTGGNKNVRLIVSNNFGSDTMLKVVNVRQLAVANFTTVQNLLTATFTNTSTNSVSYLWDFGDGMTSTVASPMHTYAAPGTYLVKLSATNACRTHVKTSNVGVTAVNDLTENIGIQILPNPTAGDFAVELDSRITSNVQLVLFDAAGRKIAVKETSVKQGVVRVPFENLDLPKGLYQLNIQANGKQATFNLAVQ
ncbi:MAG: S8 family serine peptidase [Saprospiraceae bacterium]